MAQYQGADSMRGASNSVDTMEMQEGEDGSAAGSDERLLSEDELEEKHVEYEVQWRLRTSCTIFLCAFTVLFVFLALTLFTRNIIVGQIATNDSAGMNGIASFRRKAEDYVLDSKWNFNAPSQTRTYRWKLHEIVGNPDGVFRPMLSINGQFPGPMIECNEGDQLIIEVENRMSNATSIHFHGIYQNGTNFMDGTAGITQCPIASGHSFRYEFTVTGQSGTYYYHAHQGVQAADGLYGPLIIHSRSEKQLQKIPYKSDRVIMLQDWYHDLSDGLLSTSLEPGNEGSPIPDGALINGMNQKDCSEYPQRLCDNSTTIQPSLELTSKGHHRLRFINVASLTWFQVSLDEHSLSLTEIDGTDIHPVEERNLKIGPSQRYSATIHANQASSDSFWLRSRPMWHCWGELKNPGGGASEVKAVLQYPAADTKNSNFGPPTSRNTNGGGDVDCKDMNTTAYVPVELKPAPVEAHHSYYIRSNIEIGDWRLERAFFNKSTFRPDLQKPTLHRTLEGFQENNETFTALSAVDGVNALAYDLKNDFLVQHSGVKVVDLIIQNFDEGNHPMHLHGHKFWVLGQGHGYFPGYEALGMKAEGRGVLGGHEGSLDSLIRRDVATLEGYGWLALRFVADNPGIWALHCHMAWHSEAGLVMQFIDRLDVVKTWTLPQANKGLCKARLEDLEKGSAPKDNIWFGAGIGR
ncbi:multicopper oxidase-domain-containing protein [Calycina marina]|uniref:Multicopper oxidase-domain-containing protein n=1 Tax=Calycina marina TaxID=1763456 RepID=A0A9P7Z5Q9_9HELO|nr:multicopper oxidase-domain-containing protein [Calycina marina]